MTFAEGRDRRPAPLTRRLREHIEFLASPELEGRGTPSRGLDLAASYLEGQLRAAGAEPAAGGSFQQTYRLGEYSPNAARVTASIGGQTLSPDDYVFWNISGDPAASPFRLPLVYAGQGITAPDREVDHFAGLDLSGSATLVRKGAPWELDPTEVFGPGRALGKIVGATVRGARMLVYLSDELDDVAGPDADAESRFFAQMRQATVSFLRGSSVGHSSALSPLLVVRPAAFETALGQQLTEGDRGPLGINVEVGVDASVREGEASNVVAVIPGSDPELRGEYVLLSAHYDHLGMHETESSREIWPGADDNASGVAGVIEIVRRLATQPPRRSVIIFLGSGEERAILGSAFYNAHPLIPIERIGVQLNIDMIGRSDGTIQGIADGSPELFAAAAEFAADRSIEMVADRQPDWRLVYLTDTYHFARAGTPFIFYFTGFHPDYHQPTDTPEKIQYAAMESIVEAAGDLARHYADGAPFPHFERPEWFITPPDTLNK